MSKVRATRKSVEKLAIELGYNINIKGGYCIINNEKKSVAKLGFAKAYSYLYNKRRYLRNKNLNIA